MKYTDIAIIGGGLAGSTAAAMLGRAKIPAVVIDPHQTYPFDFRVEKISGEWLDAGTFDSLLEAGNIVKQKKIFKNFDPLIDQAIAEFSEELKVIAKKRLL